MTDTVLDQKLAEATARIAQEYFQLPVAGLRDAIYRERVYCYELYHQLRSSWDSMTFTLSAEVDKTGHPLISNEIIKQSKPDFIVHKPGYFGNDSNYSVIEVKPINARTDGIEKDIRTLSAFLKEYRRALLLFYGGGDINRVMRKIRRLGLTENSKIEIWWHRRCGEPATRLEEI